MQQKITTQELTLLALLAALLCVSSYINIPIPVSPVLLTAQTLVLNLIVLLLRPRLSLLTVAVWLLLGLVGLPVFSGGQGGAAVLAGPTGGMAVGFLAVAALCSLLVQRCKKTPQKLAVLLCLGIPLLYVIGVPWMKMVTGMAWGAAWLTGCVPFLVGDVAKAVAAVVIAKPLYPLVRDGWRRT